MIAKVKLNHSISGLMNYLTIKKHLVMDSNEVLPISDPKYISKEFKKRQSFNSRCKKQNFHIILSFGNKDKIDNEKLDTICRDFIKSFFEGKAEQWIAIRHPDTQNHKHIHIALNRITRDGKALGTARTGMHSLEICRKLEKKYGLQQLSNIIGENKNKMKSELKIIIEQALQDCVELESFKNELLKSNYKVLTGRGITFVNKTNGAQVKGSAIVREYSLQGIKDRLSLNQQNISNSYYLIEPRRSLKDLTETVLGTAEELLTSQQTQYHEEQEELNRKKKKKKNKRKGKTL
ncbi:relaxase/mobilization nuclease domain-containing protein [Mesonia maritima]|uniref:MobA/VirD2-like nuclease domain-containing protein n=1 Tax=Mesonia maritima TaxID=1793873 RepID=A0ABU1K4U4_9FLAO|nr:relaxase/mobilization nuclease domain-containing protein [Mesonia maritima]MDR6300635.1 hypothetical protein [Mesonia maritima]